MEKTNRYLNYLLPYAVMCFVCYLIGAFISLSFNTADWTLEMRELMALWGVVWGYAVAYNRDVRLSVWEVDNVH